MIVAPPVSDGVIQERLICVELATVPDTDVGAFGVVAGTFTETVFDAADATGA